MSRHVHKWKKVKPGTNYVCTWGIDGSSYYRCWKKATHEYVTCDRDSRCARHTPKKKRGKKDSPIFVWVRAANADDAQFATQDFVHVSDNPCDAPMYPQGSKDIMRLFKVMIKATPARGPSKKKGAKL